MSTTSWLTTAARTITTDAMHAPDLINGLFEGFGGVLLWLNCRRLYRDKVFKGVSIVPTAFFMAWGYWNLFYYPHLDQWLSFTGGLLIVSANTFWVGQMAYYSRFPGGRGR